MQTIFQLRPRPRGMHLITDEIASRLPRLPEEGLLHLFLQHTSAGLIINENADPSVRHDLEAAFDRLAPENHPSYTHTMEGPDDMPAHIKAAISGISLMIPVRGGKMALGSWQGICLCEYRNHAGSRSIVATVLPSSSQGGQVFSA